MAWHDIFTKLLTTSTTHADNFNNIFGEALENDKHLLDQINVLSNYLKEHGYTDTAKDAAGASYKTLTTSGLYRNASGFPESVGANILQVIAGTDSWSVVYKLYYVAYGKIHEYTSCKDGTAFSEWDKVATTSKTDILCTSLTGYEITWQNNYRINNIIYLNMRVKKIDSSVFANGTFSFARLPLNNTGNSYNPIHGYTFTPSGNFGNGVFYGFSHNDGTLFGNISSNTNGSLIDVGGVVVVSL